MHYAKSVSPLVTALTVVALATDAIAGADDDVNDTPRLHRRSEILIHQGIPQRSSTEGKSWFENHMALRKGTGLVYRYKLVTEDQQKMVFSVGGPILKKRRFGMMFEVKF